MTAVEQTSVHDKRPLHLSLVASFCLVLIYWFGLPFSFGYDSQDERCLPDVHLSLLIHHPPTAYHNGDMVYFVNSETILPHMTREFAMKIVGGIPGDHILVRNNAVYINGKIVASGFPLAAEFYPQLVGHLEKDEIIPPGKLFMIGTHPLSDDSRYWGYLDTGMVRGSGYKIF